MSIKGGRQFFDVEKVDSVYQNESGFQKVRIPLWMFLKAHLQEAEELSFFRLIKNA